MRIRWISPVTALVALLFVAGVTSLFAPAAAFGSDIVYDDDADGTTIATGNATIDISKLYPAAMIRAFGDTSGMGYGFVVSAIVGYNATDVLDSPQTDARYYASLTNASWQATGPTETDGTVTFILNATVDMAERTPSSGDGSGGSGQPGLEWIEEWAEVRFTFQVSSEDRLAVYPGFPGYSVDVNGSTEVKFDISIRPNKHLTADRLAIDIGLCLMDAGSLVLAPTEESYRFYGYEANGISTSDPVVNETEDGSSTIHEFEYRNTNEQMFGYVEDGSTKAYFAWANEVMLTRSDGDSELVDSSASYCTDGECLRLFLESLITVDTSEILLDPGLGIFPAAADESIDGGGGGGGVIRPAPDDGGLFGSSIISFTAGMLIGGAVIGSGIGALYIFRRSGEEDPVEGVSLERNRYYRGERR